MTEPTEPTEPVSTDPPENGPVTPIDVTPVTPPEPPAPVEEKIEIPEGRSPNDMGFLKLRFLSFDMGMTDEQMRDMAEQAIKIKNVYTEWQKFYEDLEARKKRLLGFRSVVMAMDVTEAAKLMRTTPQLVQAVMTGYAGQEEARIVELQALWNAGKLPDRPVLTDPSKDIIEGG